jgi:hypothetical protein
VHNPRDFVVIRTTTDANGTTHFFDLTDGRQKIGSAMVFVPIAVSIVESVPMLVYFHGHNSQNSIEHYIAALPARDFRQSLSSKKVVLVEPWGGPGSNFQRLQTANGLTALIDGAMVTAMENGNPTRPCLAKPPAPPRLILSGFSGGGVALNASVTANCAYANKLTDAWAFDCLYSSEGDTHFWVNWARANPDKQVRIRVTPHSGSPPGQNKKIQEELVALRKQGIIVSNLDVTDPVNVAHEECPGTFLPQWL